MIINIKNISQLGQTGATTKSYYNYATNTLFLSLSLSLSRLRYIDKMLPQ